MTLHFTYAETDTAVFLLAHSGESHDRSSERQKTEASTSHGSETVPGSQHTNPAKLTPVEPSAASVVSDQTTLANSVMGLPFGLGELSLGLILVGPICLSAMKRWLQS